MTTENWNKEDLQHIFDFLNQPSSDERIISMDCSDCDQLAALAEKVASGTPVGQVLPELEEHMRYWTDCREEFEALVAVIKAESSDEVQEAIDEMMKAITDYPEATDNTPKT